MLLPRSTFRCGGGAGGSGFRSQLKKSYSSIVSRPLIGTLQRTITAPQRIVAATGTRMSFHFASTDYAMCFANLPPTDPEQLREEALRYLQQEFDPKRWFEEPIVSLLRGRPMSSGRGGGGGNEDAHAIETFNALGVVNGRQILASGSDLDEIAAHIATYEPPNDRVDLRLPIRKIEQELLTNRAGFLIGNQLVDFAKQDGVTEIVEAVQANAVERRLNDLLLQAEAQGEVAVNRRPVYVSCVSNFTNFLDLSRKTLRSLEAGIPCVVLGRTGGNTAQHSFRWAQLLSDQLNKENVDAGMLTYCSASLPDLQALIRKCRSRTGVLYATSSRSTALSMSHTYADDSNDPGKGGRVVASTGGPNTMVVLHPDTLSSPAVQKAIQTSASIECAGQCTALRHCVVPSGTQTAHVSTNSPGEGSVAPTGSEGGSPIDNVESIVDSMWSGTPALPDANLEQALQQSVFDGVYVGHKGTAEPSGDYPKYRRRGDAWYRVSDSLPPSASDDTPLNEYWRKVVVDFTQLDCTDSSQMNRLAAWLNDNQPISLAINGPRRQALTTGLELFRSTSLVVYTIGSHDDPAMPPALTCQARPQECEVFGEFPPRSSMRQYTRFPVFIPSSNPSYDAHYTPDYLSSQRFDEQPGAGWTCNASTRELLQAVSDPNVRGYCVLLLRYLQDVCRMNPKSGVPTSPSSRTTLWGLQRPPVGWTTVLVVNDGSVSWNDVAPVFLLFHATNAKPQVQLSVSPSSNSDILSVCEAQGLPHVVEDEAQRRDRLAQTQNVFHVVDVAPMAGFPMVDHFVSLYFPLGHIKSTRPGDDEFLLRARLSDKWLNTNF